MFKPEENTKTDLKSEGADDREPLGMEHGGSGSVCNYLLTHAMTSLAGSSVEVVRFRLWIVRLPR